MKKLFFALCCILVSANGTYAQDFASNHLEKAVSKLGIADKLSKGSKADTISVDQQRIVVRKDANGRIEHVGIPLFNSFVRSLQPSPIHDYLEFAALDKKYKISENTLQLNQLKFSKGSWDDLFQLGDTTTCSIDNLEDKMYVVKWIRQGEPFLEVYFPVDYELLANSSRREMEVRFVEGLKAFHLPDSVAPQPIDTIEFKKYGIKGIFVKEGTNYVTPVITSNTYYKKEAGTYSLLADSQYTSESFANLLLNPQYAPEATVNMGFSMSTFRSEYVEMDFRQLSAYCTANGCTPFYGFEGVTDGTASATLIMHNKKSGYNHIFYIQCPAAEIGKPGARLTGRGYLFTPSSNVKNLFGAPSKGKSRSYKHIAK